MLTSLLAVAERESLEMPPDAFLCPPPLKCVLAILLTSRLPLERRERRTWSMCWVRSAAQEMFLRERA